MDAKGAGERCLWHSGDFEWAEGVDLYQVPPRMILVAFVVCLWWL